MYSISTPNGRGRKVEGVFEEASTFLQGRYDSKIGSISSTVDAGYAKVYLGDKDSSEEIPRKGMPRNEQGGYYMGMDEEEGKGHNLEKHSRNSRNVYIRCTFNFKTW